VDLMKKLLVFIVLICLASLLGCSGNGVLPPSPPEEEPPLDLIYEYTGEDNVMRWKNGVVTVCDITGNTKDVWKEINQIIDGPVVFSLTDDTEAMIGIEILDIEYPFFSGFGADNFVFSWYGIIIHPMVDDISIYTQACLVGAGITKQKAKEGFSPSVKKVLYWLYRLEPGYPLL
jgi:hypothetical protein